MPEAGLGADEPEHIEHANGGAAHTELVGEQARLDVVEHALQARDVSVISAREIMWPDHIITTV